MKIIEKNVNMDLVIKIIRDFDNGESIESNKYFTDYKIIENREVYTDAICFIKKENLIKGLDYAMVEGKYVSTIFYDKAEITENGKALLEILN